MDAASGDVLWSSEVAVLRGTFSEMQASADSVIPQRGVRYGHLHLIAESDRAEHPSGQRHDRDD